ncbi:MAG: F0F1 ATP synthase subunit alpha [Firmicutes bacterium]|uniref:ATP synthase subunit alpha n=1 Tax=Candidatus Colimorpha enterica TaxID=3083063 RepID=R6TN39_9BACT|nr:F0F1 ATP synthase subunit alpha [Candidatus Colimorpha enterica]MCI5755526.1 F0F1 ATP synthase subunit alpha [Candidatus Colimorpha enterica]MDY2907163.1 F0F1 ATP synthase subunit alpha [Eubacteriales bacterium]CDC74848.1 aTP synthase subunit alpha [Candidatus Colimorpha enterica]
MIDFETGALNEILKKRVEEFTPNGTVYTCGTVTKVSDGVARIDNLPGRCYGELLKFGGGIWGIALDLEENGVGAVILNSGAAVSIGDTVSGTGHPVDTVVSGEVIGRVISPIGAPLDGRALKGRKYAPLEKPAPGLMARKPVCRPLETGILSIDSMIPIGKGQRELIIGDRQTGKTTIAVDTILNQKGKDVICVYCAVGQKASTVSQVVMTLKNAGAMKYTVVVASTASDSPAMQYLAPYAACSIAESFMHDGRDVLVVYDDLSKHAVAYRTMSLLLHRPPGREAYPGDVFYLHSRLLERSACLSDAEGGGTMTALPIIETTGGNISAYIPTNVISITDGQIYLESELFHSGIRPAINTGLSVSRVGRAAQYKSMRKVSGLLRIELAQYKEMAIFARFGSDIDSGTKKTLENGERLTAILNQDKNKPYSPGEEALLLLGYRSGAFDSVEPRNMKAMIPVFLEYFEKNCPEVVAGINSAHDFDDVTAGMLKPHFERWVGLA